jgi:hypothetical protein
MFRFAIRDVLWLTLVVALGLGWLADHYIQRARAESRIDAAARNYSEMLRLREILNEKVPGWER